MRGSLRLGVLAAFGVSILWTGSAIAFPDVARETKAACAACHVNPAGGSGLTDAGTAWKTDKKAPETAVAGAKYVGAAKCKMCHMKEYTSWKTTKHADAMTTLATAPDSSKAKMAAALKVELTGPADKDATCLRCHTTGFQMTGGYPAADSAATAAVAMVSCESCHGPGSQHISAKMAEKKNFINRNVTAAMCTQCHTAEMSPAFNFDEYKAKGLHVMKAAAPAK